MIYVGVDIAKSCHVAVGIDEMGVIHINSFSFPNDMAGFSRLLNALESFEKSQLLIGLESTAHYGEAFIQFFFSKGFRVAIVNPLQTSAIRKTEIRRTKNDRIDAAVIARTLMLGLFSPVQARDIAYLKLRSLSMARRNLVTLRSRSKIQLAAYADQLFPELAAFFKGNLHINTAYVLLLKHSSPGEIRNLHLTYLANLLDKSSRGRYGKDKAIALKELASRSIGVDNPILSMQVKMAIEQITLFDQQIEQVEAEMASIHNELNSVILSVPGISHVAAAAILGVLGDFSRFDSPHKIIAFAGLDPVVHQSGNFTAKSTRMSKRGSSLLRCALILTAHNVVRNNPTFAEYYSQKIAQGKSHYNALGHTAGKLIRVLFKMQKENICFNL